MMKKQIKINFSDFYNGFDKVYIKECIINGTGKDPRAVFGYTYYYTED